MTGEYPYLYHRLDYERSGYDGVLQHITEGEPELLSTFPFEAFLLDGSA